MSSAPDISAQQVRSGGTAPACAPIGWARAGFQAAVLAILVAALYWHVLYVLVYKWTNVGDWSHGFLIPVFSLYYLYNQRHRLPAATARFLQRRPQALPAPARPGPDAQRGLARTRPARRPLALQPPVPAA